MSYLKYYTIANESPQGKPRVFLICHPDDFQQYSGTVVKDILSTVNCAVYYMDLDDGWFEIFGIDMNQYNHEAFKDLLIGALMDVKHRNGRAVTFFCEKEYEKDAVECGFQCIGNYLCHRIHLG